MQYIGGIEKFKFMADQGAYQSDWLRTLFTIKWEPMLHESYFFALDWPQFIFWSIFSYIAYDMYTMRFSCDHGHVWLFLTTSYEKYWSRNFHHLIIWGHAENSVLRKMCERLRRTDGQTWIHRTPIKSGSKNDKK